MPSSPRTTACWSTGRGPANPRTIPGRVERQMPHIGDSWWKGREFHVSGRDAGLGVALVSRGRRATQAPGLDGRTPAEVFDQAEAGTLTPLPCDAGRSQTRTAPTGPTGRRRLSCRPRAAQGGIQKEKGLMRVRDIAGGPGTAAARGGDRAGPPPPGPE